MKLEHLDTVIGLRTLRVRFAEDVERIKCATEILVTTTDPSGAFPHRISYLGKASGVVDEQEQIRFEGLKHQLECHAESRLESVDKRLAALGVVP